MGCKKTTLIRCFNLLLLCVAILADTESATVKDIFSLNTQLSPRVPRDSKYYSGRYGSSSSNPGPLNRAIKPEDSPEAHEGTPTTVEKRCTRCDDYGYPGYPSTSRGRYDDKYSGRNRYDYDRYDRYDRYDDRRTEPYDDRRYDEKRYDRYDRYDDRYERRPTYDRYDRYDRYSDRYDRDRYDRRDRYEPTRDYDRGFGYDNRGYDYRERNEGYRPWDETYRGSSGFDSTGKGYYFATGRPEVGAGYWGTSGTGGGYASNWNYGGGRDDYRGSGGSGGGYRPRDPYDGYRSTSYLYGRPSSTTTNRPANSGDGDNGVTQNPQENSSG